MSQLFVVVVVCCSSSAPPLTRSDVPIDIAHRGKTSSYSIQNIYKHLLRTRHRREEPLYGE